MNKISYQKLNLTKLSKLDIRLDEINNLNDHDDFSPLLKRSATF